MKTTKESNEASISVTVSNDVDLSEDFVDVIDTILNKQEQTYEQLLLSFSQYKPGASVNPGLACFHKGTSNTSSLSTMQILKDNIVDATEAVLGNAEATLDVADKSDVHVQDSEFEEEVTLSDIPVITNGVESIHVERKQSFVQFDNFIDSNDGSDDEACTYQPSTRNHSNGVDDTHSTNDTNKATTSDLNLTLEAKSEPCSASDQSDDEDELIYDASFDRLNPGEVSDEAESESVNCNQRMLNFGSKINNNADLSIESTAETTDSGIMENAVEPFKLDEAFDYDNVVLTPKYTTAELNAFNQLIRENREKLQVEGQDTDIESVPDN